MTSTAAASAEIKPKTGVTSVTAYAGAAALLLAAAWYALVVAEVVVRAEPRPRPGQSREEWLQTYLSWFASTLADERFYGGAAIIGFLCLRATAAFVRDELELDRALTRLAAQAVAAGAIIWVVGNVAALGGHHAVGVMTDRGDPLDTIRLIACLIDDVDDAFELVGLAVMGTGFLGLRATRCEPPLGMWRGVASADSLVSCCSPRPPRTQRVRSISSICFSSSEASCCFRHGSCGPADSSAKDQSDELLSVRLRFAMTRFRPRLPRQRIALAKLTG